MYEEVIRSEGEMFSERVCMYSAESFITSIIISTAYVCCLQNYKVLRECKLLPRLTVILSFSIVGFPC